MQSYEFTGWLNRVNDKTQYDQTFSLCDVKDPNAGDVKYPQYVLFKINAKKEPLIDLLANTGLGSKVKVKFFPWAKFGVSHAGKPYCISENNVSEFTVLEAVAPNEPQAEAESSDVDSLPF